MRIPAALLPVAVSLLVAAPSHALVNGFEGGDGNQVCAAGHDWACLPADLALASDPDGLGAADVVFAGGKEEEPAGWSFKIGATGDKTDVRAVWSAAAETASESFLYLAFAREKGEGNAFFSFELNQLRVGLDEPRRRLGALPDRR